MLVALFAFLGFVPLTTVAQDRLKTMPGYEQYKTVAPEIGKSVKLGIPRATWKDEGKSFEFAKDGKIYSFDIATGKAEDSGKTATFEGKKKGKDKGPGRARFWTFENSPDGNFRAFYRDRNVWIKDLKNNTETQITTEGNDKNRTKYGAGTWVYGEELFQAHAMWWSPDGKKLAFYGFDESKIPDYYLTKDQAALQSKLEVEAYPKAGAPNPVVTLFVYDLDAKKKTEIDIRDGKPFEDSVVGHYVYDLKWSPNGKELFFHRANRKQNTMEFVAADPDTGKCRVIIHEEWLPSWVENHPFMKYLKDNSRFIWTSERNGWRNFYLYDLSGKQLATLTNHNFSVANVVRVDEDAGLLYYMATDGDNHMKLQLHKVGLDGKGDKRLTDPAFHHSVDIAPDAKTFIDTIQTHDTPPSSRLVNMDGKVLAELTKSDTSKFDKLGLKRVEMFTYKAADGETDLHGMLHFPSNFDPSKKYPLLVSVYGGPATNGAHETFTLPSGLNPFGPPSGITEYGFLVASLDSRSAANRGKKVLDSIYQRLGTVEMDDQAAGVKALWDRPYVDRNRVGIFGASYGGYASIMCMLRHPDVFQAACASSSVSDWRHYDSIYTERYMWLPNENTAGYEAGNAIKYIPNMKGRLMLFFGTADDNVHPSNTLAFIKALQKAGKSFELQLGPDQGHTALSAPRMMEFFIENLVMKQ
ncbi:MAG: DPP IV N-terminal domain-containing protein [Planctomycetes bacterium]|nr:DPP IV N-terminal domain-containing protein [Planctomycetota bacterium]